MKSWTPDTWNHKAVRIDVLINIFLVLPFCVTAYLPLTDLPNHLARQHILAEWASSPALQRYFYFKFAFVPNLALDIFTLVLRHIMPVDLAVRLFCILTVSLIFWGCRAVNRQLGGARAYRFAPFLCYGGPLQLGLLNFCFGIGISLLAFATYVRLRDSRPGVLFLILTPLMFVALLSHLAAFGLCVIAIGAFEIAEAYGRIGTSGWRAAATSILFRGARTALFLAPPLLALALFSPTEASHRPPRWSTLHDKLEGIAAITLYASPMLELSLLALAAAGFAVAYAAGTIRLRRETWVFMVIATAIYLALPRVALGGGYVDYRLPWAASFFMLAGVIPGPTRGGRAAAAWFGGLTIVRLALIASQWLTWSPTIAGVVTALRGLPEGARLAVVLGRPPSASAARSPQLQHVAAYAVAYRHAYWGGIFAGIAGQILFFQPEFQHEWEDAVPREDLRQIGPGDEYVLVLRPDFARISPDLDICRVAAGDVFELFAATPGGKGKDCPAAASRR